MSPPPPSVLKSRRSSLDSNGNSNRKNSRRQRSKDSSIRSDRDVDNKYSVVIVGCGSVGKSSITLRFVYDEFEDSYDPTRADSYRKRFKDGDNGRWCEIEILDTAGQEEYAAIRDNYYRSGEGFILVYSVADASSFQAVSDFRSQIIRSLNDPAPPLLLLGNKSDLEVGRVVSSRDGAALAEKWSTNCKWREVSAKKDEGIEAAFHDIIKLIDSKREADFAKKNGGNAKGKSTKIKEKMMEIKKQCTIQ